MGRFVLVGTGLNHTPPLDLGWGSMGRSIRHTQGSKANTNIHISRKLLEHLIRPLLQSNELAKSYTMKPITIYIDKYLGSDIMKLVVFFLLSAMYFDHNSRYLTVFCPYLFKK